MLHRISLVVVALVFSSVVHAGLQDGINAREQADYARAFGEFKALAATGNLEAQYWLALMYYQGESVPEDYKRAYKWFEKAAKGGHVDAQFQLAEMASTGKGRNSSNRLTAFRWYQRAAQRGHPDAQFLMGHLFADGVEVPQNLETAFKWYRKAAQQGNVRAQYELARFYDIGLDSVLCTTSVSPAKCRNSYGRGVEPDRKEAFQWYLKAAGQGHAAAQLRLGELYADGRGTIRNHDEAARWFTAAADQGLVEARYRVESYKKSPAPLGKKKVPDLQMRSADLRAAEDGSKQAQLKIARMYAKGLGVPKDYLRAYMWYNLAAAQGLENARSERDALEASMSPQQIADGQRLAAEMLQKILAARATN